MRVQGRSSYLLSALLALAACGADGADSSDDGGDGADDGSAADAAAGQADAAPRPDASIDFDCPAGQLGELGPVQTPQAFQEPLDAQDPDGAQTHVLFGDFGPDVLLTLILVDGRGFFEGAAATPGTFDMEDEEADLEACGVCLRLCVFTAEREFTFIPRSGELTINSVEDDLIGSAADLVLQEINIVTGEPLEDGCIGTAKSLNFEAPIEKQAVTGG
ncbi:MAG TPA: hypothetical protein VNO33_01915 [Kofleriaceae bacterium]|nr:hypothetical protein [Kofleriaceae bacterium]